MDGEFDFQAERQRDLTSGRGPVIGVFDSGFGGLTVLKALLPLIGGAQYHYLGDTARLPYGEKSRQTVTRFALSSAAFLLARGIEMLVVACNTASALALEELQAALPVPVVGVIQPGARAALAAGPGEGVLVLATAATVKSGAYTRACAALGLGVYEKACPLLVPLVEEGWTEDRKGAATAEVLSIYLGEAIAAAPHARTLLLGCTHYPLLHGMIETTLARMGHPMRIVDSAHAAAQAAAQAAASAGTPGAGPTCYFYATDSVEKFTHLGARFLGRPMHHVELVDLGG